MYLSTVKAFGLSSCKHKHIKQRIPFQGQSEREDVSKKLWDKQTSHLASVLLVDPHSEAQFKESFLPIFCHVSSPPSSDICFEMCPYDVYILWCHWGYLCVLYILTEVCMLLLLMLTLVFFLVCLFLSYISFCAALSNLIVSHAFLLCWPNVHNE